MEDELTLDELYLLAERMHLNEHRHNRFLGALQGVDIDEGNAEESFEAIKLRADAELAGKTEEEFTFSMIGIEVEGEDED